MTSTGDKVRDQMRPADVEVGEVGRVGLVPSVINLAYRGVRLADDRVEKLVGRVGMEVANEQVHNHAIPHSELREHGEYSCFGVVKSVDGDEIGTYIPRERQAFPVQH